MSIELNSNNGNDDLMTPEEVSVLLKIPRQTLSLWRMTGAHGLKFARVGRSIRYSKSDLIAWMAARSGTSLNELKEKANN
jgi:excisionase family DNA binding protein